SQLGLHQPPVEIEDVRVVLEVAGPGPCIDLAAQPADGGDRLLLRGFVHTALTFCGPSVGLVAGLRLAHTEAHCVLLVTDLRHLGAPRADERGPYRGSHRTARNDW